MNREDTILSVIPIVKAGLGRFSFLRDRPVSDEDLMQDALVQAIIAVDRYDEDQDTKLSTYVYRRAQGSFADSLRRESGNRAGREPRPTVDSLDVELQSAFGDGDGDGTLVDTLPGEDHIAAAELRMDLEIAWKQLSDREREVLHRPYHKGQDVAEEFGVTPARISQITTAARKRVLA